MTIDEIQRKINEIIHVDGREFGLSIYASLKDEQGLQLKKFKATDSLNSNIKEMLNDVIDSKYLDADVVLKDITDIDDNINCLYQFEQTDDYKPFSFILDSDSADDNPEYTKDDASKLDGFLFVLNMNDDKIYFYQKMYPFEKASKSKLYALAGQGSVYRPMEDDVISFKHSVDVLIINNTIVTDKISLLENYFGLETVIRDKSIQVVQKIDDYGIVSDIDAIDNYARHDRLSYPKKLLKIQNSPVFNIDKNVLISRITSHPRYKDEFIINDNKIKIKTQKDVTNLIKMLNDQFLKSELTNLEYDAAIKDLI